MQGLPKEWQLTGRFRTPIIRAMRVTHLALVLLLLAACGGDDPSSESLLDITFMNDILTCDNMDGRGIASGTIENTGGVTATFRIDLEFRDDTSDELLASGVAVVRSVEPGAAGEWTIEVEDVGEAGLTCRSKSISASG